jgi:hypothetical protein
MVFSGLYPIDGSDYPVLREALDKLKLSDASLNYEPETSVALGFGFRCGFLGLLHLEIVTERLEREFGLDLISTAPSVTYEVMTDDKKSFTVTNPSEFPSGTKIASVTEPMVKAAILAGTWAAAFWQQSSDGYEEGREMIEAAGFSAVTTTLLKYASRRSRPNESADPNDWRSSGDSFPSMHTSAAFAIGTVLAESGGDNHRWIRRFLGYGLAGATGYARLHDNVHWLSDTMAGAAVGIATARFVMRRGDTRDRDSAFSVMPTDGGLMLTYNATF